MKPSAFIGSSGLKYEIVEAIADRLSDEVDAHAWKTAFPVGKMTLKALVEEAAAADFGIFIFGADDRLTSEISVPRDNVVYEAGLFAGVLGTDRSLIVLERKAKRPTDLKGMTVASFDGSISATEVADAVCPGLLEAIQKKGAKRFETVVGSIEGDWWQFSLAPDGGIERAKVSFLRFRKTASGYLTFKGDAWADNGDRLARFKSNLSIVNEQHRTFTYQWTGRWFVNRKAINADPGGFYGDGEFVLSPGNPDRASGEYTTRNDSNRDLDDQTPVEYRRANPGDIEEMDSDSITARRKLIRKRLAERLEDD